MKRKKVSLIVLNYNGKEHLKEYFTSVFKQTNLPDEVVMFDNLSTDGSREYVSKYFPKVKIVTEDRYNTGTATGSNIGFYHAKGDYVIFQSNDLRLDPHCVEGLVSMLTRDKKIGIVSSVLVWYHKNPQGLRLLDSAGGMLDMYGFGMQNYPNSHLEDLPEKEEVFFTYGGSFIIRREAFKEAGGFDDRFFTLNDDLDLSWRVRLMGYKVVYTKKSIVYHKGSATIKKRAWGQKRFWAEKNSIRSFIKNSDHAHLLKSLPMYIILLFGEITYFLYRGRISLFIADIKAVLWNLWYLPDTLKLRRAIQTRRRKNNIDEIMKKTSFKLKFFNVLKQAL